MMPGGSFCIYCRAKYEGFFKPATLIPLSTFYLTPASASDTCLKRELQHAMQDFSEEPASKFAYIGTE